MATPRQQGLNLSDRGGFLPSSPSFSSLLLPSFFASFLPSFLSSSILPSLHGYLLSIYHGLFTFLQAGIPAPTLGNLWDILSKYLTNETRNASEKQCLL